MQHGRDSFEHQGWTDVRDDRKSSRGWYAQSDHIRWAWDPEIVCNACKQWGHSATNCNMLAMALFLEKYMKVLMSPSTCNRIKAAWLQHWKETLGNPRKLPCNVLRAYLDSLDISVDMLDDQMDWECWPMDMHWKILGRMIVMKWL